MTAVPDAWSSGERYEGYIGRWSRPVAARFVEWLGLPPGLRWLDVGCGTGALTDAVLRVGEASEVVGVDPSEAYIAHALERVVDPRVRFQVGDAEHLGGLAGFDVVVSGLALNFMPDPVKALAAMNRALAPGGTVAGYVWDYAGEMQLLRHFWDAAAELDQRASDLDEGVRFPLCSPDALQTLFESRLQNVRVEGIAVPTVFVSFEDYWQPFLGGQGPAPAYVASLDEDKRKRLRSLLETRLPSAPDGRIALTARAWAVRAHL